MTALREVICELGPMDGAGIDVDAALPLPESIEFTAAAVARRDIYRLVGESAQQARYRYEGTEVRG